MKFKALALAAVVSFGGFAARQAFAQGRDMTMTHETPSGAVVTKHCRARDGVDGPVMHRTTRIVRADGSTVVRRTTRVTHYRPVGVADPQPTVVLHRHYDPVTGPTVVSAHGASRRAVTQEPA